MNDTPSSEHSYVLDLLRISAAIGIAMHHYDGMYPVSNTLVHSVLSKLYILSEFFFVISGYLMSNREQAVADMPLSRFYLSRATRIYPFHWVTLLAIYALNAYICGNFSSGGGIWRFASNVFLLPTTLKDLSVLVNGPAWYIAVLLVCFGVFWLVLYFTKRAGRDPLPAYVVLVIIGIRGTERLNPIFRGLLGFFTGCILAHVLRVFRGKKVALIGFSVLIGVSCALILERSMMDNGYLIAVLILFPALFLSVLNFPSLERLLCCKWIALLAESAYCVYLLDGFHLVCHPLTLFPLAPAGSEKSVWMMLCSTAILVIISVLCHLFVEKPLSDHFSKMIKK